MTKKTFGELPFEAIALTSIVPFENTAGETKQDIADNLLRLSPAPFLLFVSNEADLEAQFTTNIIITATESWKVVALNSFTMTKPIQMGNGATLRLVGATPGLKITNTATGKIIRNENPANPFSLFILGDIELVGDGTNDIFDLVSAFSIVIERNVLFTNFNDAGTWETPFFDAEFAALQGAKIGLVIRNPIGGSLRGFSLNQSPSTPPVTFISILTNVASSVTLQDCFSSDTNSTVVFFDPNAPVGAKLIIAGTVGTPANVFAQGTDIDITKVADNGSGDTRFTTGIVAHNLEIGQPVVIKDFLTQTTYNQTAIVTAIPVTTQFDCAITFVADDTTGKMNAASLDQTDPRVVGINNVNTQNSMTISESSINGILEVDGSGGVPVAIVDITPVSGDWVQDLTTERFSVDLTTGIVTYNGTIAITGMIKYSLSAAQSSGSAQTVDFTLNINGTPQTKSTITIMTAGVGSFVAGTYNGGNFLINPGDTFQLFKDNTTNTNNTDVTSTTLLINLD